MQEVMLEMKEGNRLQEVSLSWKECGFYSKCEGDPVQIYRRVWCVHFTFLKGYWLLYGD